MRKSLFLYLFIIAVLINVFTFTYFSKQETFLKNKVITTTKTLNDSIQLLTNQLDDAGYFSYERNSNAQDYFAITAPINMESEKLVPHVVESLMAFNEKPDGNPYTGQTRISGQKFIINKARVLNHRWIIADYSDGTYWGEVLIKYFINPDNTVSFEVMQSFLYQK